MWSCLEVCVVPFSEALLLSGSGGPLKSLSSFSSSGYFRVAGLVLKESKNANIKGRFDVLCHMSEPLVSWQV